jgi:signal transduction histidine kinase
MRRIEAELHRQAREVEAAKSEFLSMISHDLRNPIATMTLVSEQLERTIASDGQVEIVQALSDSLSGMDALVTNLLDMSRLQSGTFPMQQEQCFVADVVNDAVSRVTKTPAATGRVVKIDVPVVLPPVYADPIQLRRVIENLLTNALKYSDDEVRIAADHSDGDVSCQVADRGDGVPEAEQPQIFDKFYRTKTAASRDGVGLGLAICKSIIDSHHGSIGVKTNDHGGATFWFSLRADDVRHAG